MEKEIENREDVTQANDRTTFMTDEQKCIDHLESQGYTDQFKVEKKFLKSVNDTKVKYKPSDLKCVNFYRFEGVSDPDDMSILYAIETCDGRKGTLSDGYGRFSEQDTGEFMKQVDISKQVAKSWGG